MKDGLEVIGIWFAIICGLSGGIFALRELSQNVRANQVQATMAYEMAFRSEDMAQAFAEINIRWIGAAGLEEALKSDDKFIALSLELDKDVQAQIIRVVEFYESLFICIENNACDGDVARAFFQREAESFRTLHLYTIEEIRMKYKNDNFGAVYEKYALTPGEKKSRSIKN